MGYVYVFDFGDMVKVGVSVRPNQRLLEIQKSNGVKAVRTWAIYAEEFSKEIELKVHIKLQDYLIQGNEYFNCTFATARDVVIDTATEILGHMVSGDRVDGARGRAQKEATARYNKKAYDRIEIKVKKGRKEDIFTFARSKNKSINQFIVVLIDREMGRQS